MVLTPRADGSVLASRREPGRGRSTRSRRSTSLPRITAIRLEALPDPSLPKGGPGRDPYGNFQLNGFEVERRRLDAWRIKAIRADDAVGRDASFDTFFPKTLSRDVVRAARMADRCEPGGEAAAAADCLHARAAAGDAAAGAPTADSPEAPGRRRRTGARAVPAVGHVQRHAAARSSKSRPGCGRSWRSPPPSAPSSSARISQPSTGPSRCR